MPLDGDALLPLLRLSLVPGIGPARLASLLARYGSAHGAFAAPSREVAMLRGFGPELARRIGEYRGPAGDTALRHAVDILRRAGAVAIGIDDERYPEPFRSLSEPPFLLFAAGDLELLRAPAVAFVGTRSPSPYGRAAAIELAGGLARAGYAVVSGMATPRRTRRRSRRAGRPSACSATASIRCIHRRTGSSSGRCASGGSSSPSSHPASGRRRATSPAATASSPR
jgi:hypothetical protein